MANEERRPESASEARARRAQAASDRAPKRFAYLRLSVWVVAGLLVAGGTLMAYQRAERFLIQDERFTLLSSEDGERTLTVTGATHASLHAIEQVFDGDVGRSIYLVPLSDRRNELRAIDWIQDVSVARIWPNRIAVRVKERVPVAFVTLPNGTVWMIDGDGVLLPQVSEHYKLPVLAGVKASDPIQQRKTRVHRMQHLLEELGPDANKVISEVDVADADNLQIAQVYAGRAIRLMLGDRQFGERYKNFTAHFAEIDQKLPDARTLDLRIEDRITVVE